MKSALIVIMILSWIGSEAADFALIRNGEPAAVIVKPADKAVAKAVADFNDGVRRCAGKPLPVSERAEAGKNRIVVELKKAPLQESDRFSVVFPDAQTMKITATKLSVRWAFNYILEEHFGCRFLFPVTGGLQYDEGINHYPAARDIAIPMRKVEKGASFDLGRELDWRLHHWDWRWNSRMVLPCVHLMTVDVFPVHKYAADQSWPKEMLPVLNGKKYVPPKPKGKLDRNPYRAGKNYSAHWNPCFSHPKSAEIAIANILEILAREPDRKSICLTINDNGGMCQCPDCLKAVGRKINEVKHRNYSPVYWKWVDTIARAVSRKYPELYFAAAAYREVIDPPDFKLHPKVVPQLCFELVSLNDPKTAAARRDLLRRWKDKAAVLGLYDYSYGICHYLFPRIYFKSHSRLLEEFYGYNGRTMYAECRLAYPCEGPKYYLMARKLMDIKADPEKIVTEWCETAVGKEAAPYLRQYYQFWEDYWNGPEIRKTLWYPERIGTYYPLGELPSHTLALKKGDMKKLRSLMEKTVACAKTPEQKKRAGILMQWFEYSELVAKALFSELVQPDMSLGGKDDALEMIRQLPGAVRACEKLMKHPFIKYYAARESIPGAQLTLIGLVQPYISDPDVKAAAQAAAAAPETSLILRSLLKIWLGTKPVNLVKNGSFEEKKPLPLVLWKEGGAFRSNQIASDGVYSYRMPPKCTYAYRIPVKAGKNYLFMFDCYIRQSSIEGLFNFQLTPLKKKRPYRHHHFKNRRLTPGKWTTFTGICCAEKATDTIELLIWLRKFEDQDEIYLDNVRVYCLEDLQ